MDAFQIPPEMRAQIEASQGEPEEPVPDEFIVLEENWSALALFFTCTTQWRYSFSGITGLDYTALINVINLKHKKNREQLFDDVRLIESGALQAISRKRERNGKTV